MSCFRHHRPSGPVAGHPELSNPYVQANQLQRSWEKSKADPTRREEEIKLRRAVRLIREELLDDKHALDRILSGEVEAIRYLKASAWEAQHAALLEHGEPEPHTKGSAAYRELSPIMRLRYRGSRLDSKLFEEDPSPSCRWKRT